MTYHAILKRYTGFDSPIFGLQWEASDPKVEAARDVIDELEERDVLYQPIHVEEISHYVEMIDDVREALTTASEQLEYQSPLEKQVRKMRRASRRFIDRVGHSGFDTFAQPVQASVLRRELNRLRDKFGESVAEISISHGVSVDDDLASIIPFDNFSG